MGVMIFKTLVVEGYRASAFIIEVFCVILSIYFLRNVWYARRIKQWKETLPDNLKKYAWNFVKNGLTPQHISLINNDHIRMIGIRSVSDTIRMEIVIKKLKDEIGVKNKEDEIMKEEKTMYQKFKSGIFSFIYAILCKLGY
jgi:hypothetical protein